jgi:hypothetical protein
MRERNLIHRFLFSYDFEQIFCVFCLYPPTHPPTDHWEVMQSVIQWVPSHSRASQLVTPVHDEGGHGPTLCEQGRMLGRLCMTEALNCHHCFSF